MKKRTEGKIKECIGLKETYQYYKKNSDKPVDYETFAKCIKDCNKKLLDEVVNASNDVELPYRLGKLHIAKFDRSYKNQKKWAVDFKKTKEEGRVVYFDQDHLYKWRWCKTYTIVKNKSKYKFTASRQAKRLVPVALKNNVEYFRP